MFARLKTWCSAIGLCAVALTTILVVARTNAVAGSWIRTSLHQWIQNRSHDQQWALQIGSVGPAGFTGLTFDRVRIRGTAKYANATALFDSVTVYPDFRALLGGQLTVDEVVVRNGDVIISPQMSGSSGSSLSEPAEPDVDETVESNAGSDSNAVASPGWVKRPDGLDLTAKRLNIRGSIGETNRTRPWHLESITATIGSLEQWATTLEVRGYGATESGIPFTLETRRGDASSSNRVDLTPLRTLSGADVISESRLRPLGLRALSFCPGCTERFACATTLHWRGGEYVADSRRACFSASGKALALRLAPIDLRRRDDDRTMQVRETSVRFEPANQRLRLHTEISDGDGGLASINLFGRPDRTRPLIGELKADTFALDAPMAWSGVDHMEGATLDGQIVAGWSPVGNQLRLKGDAELTDTRLNHPLIGADPIPLDRVQARWISQIQLDQTIINVPRARVRLADTNPVEVTGYLAAANPGWSFATEIRGREISAPELHRRMPEILTKPASGTRLSGAFDSRVRIGGHTERPERLSLDVEIDGGVDVQPVEPVFDLPTLAATGPPSPYAGTKRAANMSLDDWVSLNTVPDWIPRAVTAAEDVHFFDHDGFAWGGLRNAMVHNLEVGRLERGGSTITQQVAKNLFLTPSRTLTRKIHEMWLTWRLEARLSKRRIMELYLNIADWGPESTRGIRQAARHFFDRSPEELTTGQVTLLASLLPAPAYYGELIDNGYLPSSRLEKIEHILQNLAYLDIIDEQEHERLRQLARRGHPGGLDLALCEDTNPPRRDVPAETPTCKRVLES